MAQTLITRSELWGNMRTAAATAFDHSFSDECFRAVDAIVDAILDDGLTDVDEIADTVPSVYDREVVNQWFGLNAQGAASDDGYPLGNDPIAIMRTDVFAVALEAAVAALAVYDEAQED